MADILRRKAETMAWLGPTNSSRPENEFGRRFASIDASPRNENCASNVHFCFINILFVDVFILFRTISRRPSLFIYQISDDSGIQLSFDEIRMRTIRVALNLRQRGYKAGQVFGIIASRSHNLAPIIYASFCLGCPYNTLAVSFAKEEIKHMLNITKPRLVFCDVEAYDKLAESLEECHLEAKIITMNGKIGGCEQIEDLLAETVLESTFRPTPLDGSKEIAAIFCSSGTTGLSKGN